MQRTTSRRAVLAGIATVPALAAPALAMSGPDPIFAAIELHRVAHAAYALGYKLSDVSWPEDEDGSSDDFAAALLRSLYSALSDGIVS